MKKILVYVYCFIDWVCGGSADLIRFLFFLLFLYFIFFTSLNNYICKIIAPTTEGCQNAEIAKSVFLVGLVLFILTCLYLFRNKRFQTLILVHNGLKDYKEIAYGFIVVILNFIFSIISYLI